jgi:transcriptional regulator with XRE-family HTH domain
MSIEIEGMQDFFRIRIKQLGIDLEELAEKIGAPTDIERILSDYDSLNGGLFTRLCEALQLDVKFCMAFFESREFPHKGSSIFKMGQRISSLPMEDILAIASNKSAWDDLCSISGRGTKVMTNDTYVLIVQPIVEKLKKYESELKQIPAKE